MTTLTPAQMQLALLDYLHHEDFEECSIDEIMSDFRILCVQNNYSYDAFVSTGEFINTDA